MDNQNENIFSNLEPQPIGDIEELFPDIENQNQNQYNPVQPIFKRFTAKKNLIDFINFSDNDLRQASKSTINTGPVLYAGIFLISSLLKQGIEVIDEKLKNRRLVAQKKEEIFLSKKGLTPLELGKAFSVLKKRSFKNSFSGDSSNETTNPSN